MKHDDFFADSKPLKVKAKPKSGFSDYAVGDKVMLQAGHPAKGDKGRVVRHERFAGKPSMVVALIRDDALDGHEVGVTDPKQVRKV